MNNKPNEVPRIPTKHIKGRVVLIRYNSSKLFNKHRNNNRNIKFCYDEMYIKALVFSISHECFYM